MTAPTYMTGYQSTRITKPAPKDLLVNAQQSEWDNIQNNYMPIFQQMADGMKNTRADMLVANRTTANEGVDLLVQQAMIDNKSTGVAMSDTQRQASNRAEVLSRSSALSAGENASVDQADAANQETAYSLLNMATSLRNQGISDMGSAAGIQTGRETSNTAAATASKQQAVGTATAIASAAIMAF